MPLSRANGVDIWYEVTGEGPALVLVHANPFDHDLWMYQAAHFSTWFKVIGIDIRGYGRSAKVTTPYGLKDMCNDVIGVMDDLGAARAICGGCSVGSSIAILLGLDHPDRFDALILVGGNSGSSDRYPKRIEGYRSSLSDYHIRHLRDLVSPQFAASPLGQHLLNQFVERQPRLSGEAIAQVFMAGNHTDTTARLPAMQVPTLVINGELDHSLPAGQRTAGLVPGAVHKILPGTGHACCIEDPAGFDRLVIDFLRGRGLMPSL
ncbi:MAG TPA: alpha/beta hydrolase [Xanthobacteraceae bacterium]|jgi:3-oxoadipate enol-lactonase|nr:alpha/beta hydrolase [Xanthobacteraceae bacterium]